MLSTHEMPTTWQQREGVTGAVKGSWLMALVPFEGSRGSAAERVTQLVHQYPILRTRLEHSAGVGLTQRTLSPAAVHVRELRFEVAPHTARGSEQLSDALQCSDSTVGLAHPLRAAVVCHQQSRWLAIAAPSALCDERSLQLLGEELAGAQAGDAAIEYAKYTKWALDQSVGKEADADRRHFDLLAQLPSPKLPDLRLHISDANGKQDAWTAARVEVPLTRQVLGRWDPGQAVAAAAAQTVAVITQSESTAFHWHASGRDMEELTHAIGAYARWLPIGLDRRGCSSLDQLRQMLVRVIEASEERLELYDPARFSARRTQAGQDALEVALCVQDRRSEVDGIEIIPTTPFAPDGTKLVMVARVRRHAVELTVLSHCAAVDAAFGQIIANRWKATLELLWSDPHHGCTLSGPLGASEIEQLQGAWASGPLTKSYPGTVLQSISEHAADQPEAIAVQSGDAQLSYGQLYERAGRLASQLKARGVAPGDCVPVLMSRSVEGVAAYLGTWRAGASYTPIDPQYPTARILSMLRQLGATWAVTTAAHRELVASLGIEVLYVDASGEACEREPQDLGAVEGAGRGMDRSNDRRAFGETSAQSRAETSELPAHGPDTTAYVLFTSGSSGAPRGVTVSHRNLMGSCASRTDLFGRRHERTLLMISASFDSAIAPIYNTLLEGGTLFIAPEGMENDPRCVGALIREQQITNVYCNPTVWRWVLSESTPTDLQSVRAVAVAAESCMPDVVARHFQGAPGALLVNEYGPTEATVWCTGHVCSPDDAARPRIPIGDPIANSRIYVLDAELRLCPVGVAGSVFIGGEGVASGYHRMPSTTAARFLPDPFVAQAGARMYDSGDLGRMLPNGSIEFWGRRDSQIKLRGYRIEPREIDSIVLEFKGVNDVATRLRDVDGRPALVTYVASGRPVPVERMRAAIGDRLPSYMMPAFIEAVGHLPRTVHGKVDDDRLPPPSAALTVTQRPRNALEAVLSECFAELLGRDHVGIDQSFFDLGGDSILAIRLRASVERRGYSFSLVDFMREPTVAKLARLCHRCDVPDEACGIGALWAVERRGADLTAAGSGRRLPIDAIAMGHARPRGHRHRRALPRPN